MIGPRINMRASMLLLSSYHSATALVSLWRVPSPWSGARLNRHHCAPLRSCDGEAPPTVELVAKDDSLTLESLTAALNERWPRGTDGEAEDAAVVAALTSRLPRLAIARTTVGPSTVSGAGRGLFATRDIEVGELVTIYPCDALLDFSDADSAKVVAITWGDHNADRPDRLLGEEEVAASSSSSSSSSSPSSSSSSSSSSSPSRKPPTPPSAAMKRARCYELALSPLRSVVADERNVSDAAYLGHLANDFLACSRAGALAAAYEEATEAASNAGHLPIAGGRAFATVATRPIRAGDEVLVVYGAEYWLSKVEPRVTRRFSFPDGSMYFGETRLDAAAGAAGVERMHGQGEWRATASGPSERYVGEFVDDAFDGEGTYYGPTTATAATATATATATAMNGGGGGRGSGATFQGRWRRGQFHGAGCYTHEDGSAEVGRYEDGRDVGAGARWLPDRSRAWRLVDGQQAGEIPLDEAAAIADTLGLPVPPSATD